MLFNFWRRQRNPQAPSSRGRGRRPRRPRGLRQTLTLELLESRLAPASHEWTGLGLTPNWSDPGNWSGGAPAAGESNVSLIFPSAAQLTNNNDITGLTVASIQFSQSSGQYDLTGNSITVAGNTTISDQATTAGGAADTIAFTLNQQPVTFGTSAFFDHVYAVASGNSLNVSGQITGAPVLNSLHKTGDGILQLSNSSNDFGGTVQIDAGTLAQGVANATPPNPCSVAQGATFDLGGFDATLGSLSGAGTVSTPSGSGFVTLTTGLDNSNTTFSGTITGPLNLVKAGTGTFTLAALNAYTGSTSVQAGTLAQGVANATPPSPCNVAQEATFDMGGFDATLGSVSGAGTVSQPPTSIFDTLTTGLDNTSTSFTGLITGNLNLVKAGSGTFTLGAVNTYAGSTTIQAGRLALGIDNATPPSPCIVALGATFDVAFHNETLGSLAGAGAVLLSDPTLTTGVDNTSTTFSGSISGNGNLTKVGTGTFTLSGSNTYTGQTSVLGGTLQVTGSLSPSTSVSVAPGANVTGTATLTSATVNGTTGNDTFVIDTTGVTLNGTPIVTTPYTNLTVNGGGGNDTFLVEGIAVGSAVILNSGSGSSTFTVGSTAKTLDPIQGVVTVNGNGSDTLNVYDQGTSSGQAYGVSTTQITRTPLNPPNPLGSPTQTINYSNIASVNVYGGSGADLWSALSTSPGTATALFSGGGSVNQGNEFVVENAADVLDDIQGPLAIHGGGVYDFAEAYDGLNTVGHTYTLTTGMLQRDGMANITYDDLGEFIVATANNPYFGHSPNTVNVLSLGNISAPIAVGAGDTVTVGQNGSTAAIVGDVRIQDQLGQVPKQVTLDDSNDTTARTITLGSDPAFGYLVNGLANSSQGLGRIGLLLDPATPVSIRTGTGNDAFRVHDLAGVPRLALDAGGGTNTLDYSAYQGTVQVLLPLGVATGFAGGIKNIENVTGGQGNNLLVGDANPNVLIGGTGRNVIIGGGGGDTLNASAATSDNILIGGTTAYDTNLVALDAIFAEWTRTDLGFRDRFTDLTTGTNGKGTTPLNQVNGQLILLTPTTVHADASPDTLIGSNQIDPATGQRVHNWFFYDFDDLLVNFLSSSDHKTKVG